MIIKQKNNAGPGFLIWRACLPLFETVYYLKSQITVQMKLEANLFHSGSFILLNFNSASFLPCFIVSHLYHNLASGMSQL